MWRSYYWDNFSFWPFGSFLNILCLALIICAIVYLAKNSSKNQSIPPKKQDEAGDKSGGCGVGSGLGSLIGYI